MEIRNRSGAISSMRAITSLRSRCRRERFAPRGARGVPSVSSDGFPDWRSRTFWIAVANLFVRLYGGSVMSRPIVTDGYCRKFAYIDEREGYGYRGTSPARKA